MIPLTFSINICKPELLSATYTYQATKEGWGGGGGDEGIELMGLKDQSTLINGISKFYLVLDHAKNFTYLIDFELLSVVSIWSQKLCIECLYNFICLKLQEPFKLLAIVFIYLFLFFL